MSLEGETKSGVDVKGIVEELMKETMILTEKTAKTILGRYGEDRIAQALKDLVSEGELITLYPDGVNSENTTPENTYYYVSKR